MRVGITFFSADKYFSGVECYSLNLINALVEFAPGNKYFIFTNMPAEFENLSANSSVRIVDLKHIKNRIQRIVWEHLKLARLAEQFDLDLLHCPAYICPAGKTKIPYIVTVHDTIAVNRPNLCKITNAIYYKLAMPFSLKKASHVISVSSHTKKQIINTFAIESSRITTIYPGLDPVFSSFDPKTADPSTLKEYNLPKRFILHVGNIEPKKNLTSLIKAFGLLKESADLPHKLVLAGKRSWKARKFHIALNNSSYKNNIILPGYIQKSHLPHLYALADVCVFPSIYEGFGFGPLESMACGTPAIVSNNTALAETASGGAYLTDPAKPDKIAEAMEKMLTDKYLREKHINLSLRHAAMFTWEKYIQKLLPIYEMVAQKKP